MAPRTQPTKAAKARSAAKKSSKATDGPLRLSTSHKAALALGREEGHAVRRYLEALEATKRKRGRVRTIDSIQRRLATIEKQIAGADPVARLQLFQERTDLQAELRQKKRTASIDVPALEADFVRAAKGYSERKGITYATWRAAGIDAAVLKKAGITR